MDGGCFGKHEGCDSDYAYDYAYEYGCDYEGGQARCGMEWDIDRRRRRWKSGETEQSEEAVEEEVVESNRRDRSH